MTDACGYVRYVHTNQVPGMKIRQHEVKAANDTSSQTTLVIPPCFTLRIPLLLAVDYSTGTTTALPGSVFFFFFMSVEKGRPCVLRADLS